jgi:hypothetical protein
MKSEAEKEKTTKIMNSCSEITSVIGRVQPFADNQEINILLVKLAQIELTRLWETLKGGEQKC